MVLGGEAGEILNKASKVWRDCGGVMTDGAAMRLRDEIGDVLWGCATLALDLGFDLEDVAKRNIEKLADRQRRGVLSGSGDNR